MPYRLLRAFLIMPLLLTVAACGEDPPTGPGTTPGQSTNITPIGDLTSANFSAYQVTVPAASFKVIIISNYTAAIDTTAGWWNDAVVYQVYSAKYNSGNLPHANQRLDHVTYLGCDAVWTTPIFSSPSEHGYDATDYSNVKSSYGGNSAFDSYVTTAHGKGIKVILDVVPNHTANEHPWFTDSMNSANGRRDWYVWSNTQPLGWGAPWGGAGTVWFSGTGGWYYGAFSSGMPDLNHDNPAVQAALTNILQYWLAKGADGYRLDAVRYLVENGPLTGQRDTAATKARLVTYQAALKSFKSDAMSVGEAWCDTLADTAGYYSSGSGLDQCFSFQFAYAARDSVKNNRASDLRNYVNTLNGTGVPGRFFAPFLDNHDNPLDSNNRYMDAVAGFGLKDWAKAKLGAALLLTFPGTPYLYYGTEIGMNSSTQSGDAGKRAPMDWATVAAQKTDAGSLLNTYRALILLRKAHDGLRRGPIKLVSSPNGAVLAYIRPGTTHTILVVANLGATDAATTLDFTGTGLSSAAAYKLAQLPVVGTAGTNAPGYVANNPSMYLRDSVHGWSTPLPMSLVANNTWRITASGITAGAQFKFERDGVSAWGLNWGDDNADGIAVASGGNITVTATGTVTFTFNDSTLAYTMSN